MIGGGEGCGRGTDDAHIGFLLKDGVVCLGSGQDRVRLEPAQVGKDLQAWWAVVGSEGYCDDALGGFREDDCRGNPSVEDGSPGNS